MVTAEEQRLIDEELQRKKDEVNRDHAKVDFYKLLAHAIIYGLPLATAILPVWRFRPNWLLTLPFEIIIAVIIVLVYFMIYVRRYVDEKTKEERFYFFKNVSSGEKDVPTQRGVYTIWGKNMLYIAGQGLQFIFPYFPLMLDLKAIDAIIPEDLDFYPSDIVSKNGAQVFIDTAISYAVDWDDPHAVLKYINAGGKPGVLRILDNIQPEAIRAVAADKTDMECRHAGEAFSEAIASVVLGGSISADDLALLKGGKAKIPFDLLGIIIMKLNVTKIKLSKKLMEKIENEAGEEADARAEKKEIENIKGLITKLVTPDSDNNYPGMPVSEARQVVQSERGKVPMQIIDNQYTAKGLEPTAAATLALFSSFSRGGQTLATVPTGPSTLSRTDNGRRREERGGATGAADEDLAGDIEDIDERLTIMEETGH